LLIKSMGMSSKTQTFFSCTFHWYWFRL
jgi:hypothetical protein